MQIAFASLATSRLWEITVVLYPIPMSSWKEMKRHLRNLREKKNSKIVKLTQWTRHPYGKLSIADVKLCAIMIMRELDWILWITSCTSRLNTDLRFFFRWSRNFWITWIAIDIFRIVTVVASIIVVESRLAKLFNGIAAYTANVGVTIVWVGECVAFRFLAT